MCVYLKVGGGEAWAGQKRDVASPWARTKASDLLLLVNLGPLLPTGSVGVPQSS